ncbi:uncharacterized protein LOC135475956 [Liolophura sinensis]|uniref:uncharacterized protein LOC135475956 n=1 Tax=Liolophura sinensis TaxID=3198878 RepID=UPI0031597AC8
MKVVLCLLVVGISSFRSNEAATTFDHAPLVYNFYDVMAQAACAARGTTTNRIWAMRRSCSGVKTCHQICNGHRLTCIHAYHVYKNPKILLENSDMQTDEGVNGLSMTNYVGGCSWRAGHCGPNYCCCEGPWNTPFP